MRTLRTTLLVSMLALGGCAADVYDDAVSAGGLVEAPDALSELDSADDWRDAPAGCEDRLVGEITFRVASLHYGLVAAVDGDGAVVCVDTLDAVQEELEEHGDRAGAEDLGDRYFLAVSAAPQLLGLRSMDPSPQPSTGDYGAKLSDDGDHSDPSPQPSRPSMPQ